MLWLKDGTMSPLDYKYTGARETVFKTHRMQIVLYAMLIREVYQQAVTRRFVAYVQDGSQLMEVPVTKANIAEARLMIEQIFDIITTGKLPRKTPHRIRCDDCCYKNICV